MLAVNLLLTAALAAPPSLTLPPQGGGKGGPRGAGAVTYVTAGQTYLDAGAEDGLTQGMDLELRRGGKAVGRCRVEALAPNHAVCAGARARVGDTFRFQAAPEPPPPRVLPPPPGEEVLENRRAVVEAAPVALVQTRPAGAAGSAPVARARSAEVAVTHASWASSTAGPSHRESLDVFLRGVPVASWLALDVDARAEHWLRREHPRFRPADDTQLYVWQAQLTATPTRALMLSAGRVLPWAIPGATVFDGAMAGLRGKLGRTRAEAGVFGGVVPEPDTLGPTSRRATGGAYWNIDRTILGAMLRHEGRIALVRSPELGTRGEASLAGHLYTRKLDLSAEAHLGAGGEEEADALVDAARVEAAFRPISGLALGGAFRHAGLTWPQPFEPTAFPGHTRQADGFVAYDVGPWLRIGATAGLSEDLDSELDRKWFGPELSIPRLLRWMVLSLGYLEERGWLAGRSAYAQVVARPLAPLRFLVRGSWARGDALGIDRDEIAVYASGSADLSRLLALRLSLHGRTALGAEEGAPYGLTGFATLVAGF